MLITDLHKKYVFLSQISSLQFSTRRQTKTVLEEIIQGTQKPQLSQCRKHPYKWKVYTFTMFLGRKVQFQSTTRKELQFQTLRLRKGSQVSYSLFIFMIIFIIYLHDQIITTPNNVHLSSGPTNSNLSTLVGVLP